MLEPGQIFASRYRVRRCIAEGGMGAIFEAEHTATERRVALKLLFPHIMSVGNALEKFELEAKISARVNSPYIVEVLDAGFDPETKSPFLAMELLDGQTLARHIAENGPLGVDSALRLLDQVAAGLDAAHGYREPGGIAKPIVHRDLKPENLFLARQHDGSIVAKILDFGIAKVLGGTANISQDVRGTPLFMAFEQITAGTLSAQTDIWAYGLIAYHMLTGARYWRSAERQGVSVQALFAEILSLPLEAPSVRLREQNVSIELPPTFDAWLLRCIDRDASRRFASAGAAAEALGRVFEQGTRPISRPAPERVLGAERTQTFMAADVSARASSAGSVPAMATTKHRRSFPASAVLAKPLHWVAAGAVGGALLLGSIVWLASGDSPSGAPAASSSSSVTRGAAAPGSATPGSATPGSATPDAVAERTASVRAASSPSVTPDPDAEPASAVHAARSVPKGVRLSPLSNAARPPSPSNALRGEGIRRASPDAPASGSSARSGSSVPSGSASPSGVLATPRVRIAPLDESLAAPPEPAPPGEQQPAPGVMPEATPEPARDLAAPASEAEPRKTKPKGSRKPKPGSSEAYRWR